MTAMRIRKNYLILFVVLVIFTVFYSALWAEILSVDDEPLFNCLINLNGWSFKDAFSAGGGYYYRPLLVLTWFTDTYLWGPHESFMHLENILLHAANCVLVFYITDEIARSSKLDSPGLPLVAALLFGLHPLTCEPANWISGRSDLLAGFFVLGAMLLLVKGVAKSSLPLVTAAACSFFMGTLAKESALFWYPAALFFVFSFRRELARTGAPAARQPSVRGGAPYLLLSLPPACYFLVRHFAFKKDAGGAVGLAVQGAVAGQLDLLNKLRITVKVFGFYLKKLILPLPLNFAIISVPNWYVPVGIAGVLFCLWLVYRRSVKGALLLMAACIISPALLVPLGRMAWTPVAERYLYIPSAFTMIALVLAGGGKVRRAALPEQGVLVVMALVLTACGYVTYQRNLIWQHNLTIFQDTVAKSPDYAPAKNELARALELAGRKDEARRIYLTNVVAPTDKFMIISEINRANKMSADDDVDGAIAHLEGLHYVSSQPMYDRYLKTMIRLYGVKGARSTGRRKRAIQLKEIGLTKELQQTSGDPYLLYRIGQLYVNAEDIASAAVYFKSAAEKAPADAFYKLPAQKLADRLGRRM